jgi:hypothetical protein
LNHSLLQRYGHVDFVPKVCRREVIPGEDDPPEKGCDHDELFDWFCFQPDYVSHQKRASMASGEEAEKAKQRKKQIKKMGKLLATIWELDADFQHDLTAVGKKIDQESYSHGKAGWHEFAKHVGGIYQNHITRCVRYFCFFLWFLQVSRAAEMHGHFLSRPK